MAMENIHIIGTSHISPESVREIEGYVEKEKPGIVAVELDINRFYALQQKRKRPSFSSIAKVGLTGFIFGLIGYYVEQKLGNSIGISPGTEMMHAAKLAKKHNLRVVFIDQDIEITLKRLTSSITWKEKWRFLADLDSGLFTRKRQLKKMGIGEIDLSKVPEQKLIEKLIGHVRQRYPNVYKVLIKERNSVMARNLLTISSLNPGMKILAVVGAGHREGINEIMDKSSHGKVDYTFSISMGKPA